MRKEHRNSAQCAWLFSHAHLIGKPGIQIKDWERCHLLRNLTLVSGCVLAASILLTSLTAFVLFVFRFARGFAFFVSGFALFTTGLRCRLPAPLTLKQH